MRDAECENSKSSSYSFSFSLDPDSSDTPAVALDLGSWTRRGAQPGISQESARN